MHSRNFSLQRAGDSEWIIENYNFEEISKHIDELVFLDVSREDFDRTIALHDFIKVTNNCFVPKSFGGRLRSFQDFENCFSNGADKIVINKLLCSNPDLVREASKVFGSQSIIGSIDVKKIDNQYFVFLENGSVDNKLLLEEYIKLNIFQDIGEVYLNSIDKDGTGQDFDLSAYQCIASKVTCPIILAGGAGNASHFMNALKNSNVDALATANLFNFIGNGLQRTREELLENDFLFPLWDPNFLSSVRNIKI
tara:strand:+ start:296 stop:1051 length:756 start_codon:yes stop_codon:yes gene_type:complete